MVHLFQQMQYVLHLVGGNYCVEQAHLPAAVAAVAIDHGDAVHEGVDIGIHNLLWLLGGDLEGHPLEAVIKVVNGLGGNELKQDGISRVLPPKQKSKQAQHGRVEEEHILPDGFADPVGHVEGDEIQCAPVLGGRASAGNTAQ